MSKSDIQGLHLMTAVYYSLLQQKQGSKSQLVQLINIFFIYSNFSVN